MIGISAALVLVSAVVLALELVLMRALSIGQWHHFAYLVISTALLGFGCSGTLISICQRFFRKRAHLCLWLSAVGLAVTIPATFHLAQKIPFDQLQLVWDFRQVFYLLGLYILFAVPFFWGGSFICLAFTLFASRSHLLYFLNLTGSGIGAAAFVILMYGNSPSQLLIALSVLAFLSAVIIAAEISYRALLATLLILPILLILLGTIDLGIKINENKSLVFYRAIPDAEIIATSHSPLGQVDIVKSQSIRYVPGLSIGYKGPVPEQSLLITDADSASVINSFKDPEELRCYDFVTSALAYHLLSEPNVCVTSAGGGTDIAQALYQKARHITAVEKNSDVVKLLRNKFAAVAAGIYSRPNVSTVISEARTFLQRTKQRFDLIQMSLGQSAAGSAAGLYSLNESHLYTVEAVEKALRCLTDHGLLSVTCTLDTPPRNSLKLLATISAALRNLGIVEAEKHIIMIRSWATSTIVACLAEFSESQIYAARQFARTCCFDLVAMPGISKNDVNKYYILQEPVYYDAATAILGRSYEDFYENYIYNIKPATDDRPYFFDFFRWTALPHMVRTMPDLWLQYSQWGYLVVIAAFVQACIVSAVFIVFPLVFSRSLRTAGSAKTAVLSFFLLIGVAYMFLEMAFIQKMTLLIGDPVFGAAVAITGFMIFSGLGSLASQRMFTKPSSRVRFAITAVIAVGIAELILLYIGFDLLVGIDRLGRVAVGLAICGLPAFFMGIPFPTAMTQLSQSSPAVVPWAWAANSFASVTAAVLGTCISVSAGFSILVAVALVCYLIAGAVAVSTLSHHAPSQLA
ncbi:MAG: hypothetical protein ABIG61_13930 [Planctomycetota bacterium]